MSKMIWRNENLDGAKSSFLYIANLAKQIRGSFFLFQKGHKNMSASPLPINDYDVAAISNQVQRWQSNGLFASFDIAGRSNGVALIILENCLSLSYGFAALEIRKFGIKRFIGKRSYWVIQLYAGDSATGPFHKKGCVTGNMLVSALAEAELDIRHNFISKLSMEWATNSV
ncbi:MAG: hypothetical protein JJT99_02015 [Rhodobacteraceae bacterium]|nr:hypothetical protein [Paracoccaceae bacterium]